jgi:starvation-inducible DNA-binding protein
MLVTPTIQADAGTRGAALKPRRPRVVAALEDDRDDALIEVLNINLANALELRARAKQAHWNAKGREFYGLHQMFDRFCGDLDAIADELGERVMALGGLAAGTVPQIMASTTLPTYPADARLADDHLAALISSYRAAKRQAHKGLDLAQERGDAVSADILTGLLQLIDEQKSFIDAMQVP